MCTSMYWLTANGPLIANNEDIFLETGMLFTNQRGISKQALLLPPDTPLHWVSRFGSLVFSQCGKEFASAGMNEAGLVIEQMTLRETCYPVANDRPALNELQLIQYLLDTCVTAAEAVDRMGEVRIAQASALIHYLLVDRTGDAAVIEYLNGQMVALRGAGLPVRALTNSTYANALSELAQPGLVSGAGDNYEKDSLRRFQIAERWARQSLGEDAVKSAFQGLKDAAREDTIWRIVYDPQALAVHIQTRWSTGTRRVDLRGFDFSPAHLGKVYDLHTQEEGDITGAFVSYSTAINHALVTAFFRNETISQIFGYQLPDAIIDGFAAYPESLQPN